MSWGAIVPLAVLGLFFGALLSFRPGRRLLVTVSIGLKYLLLRFADLVGLRRLWAAMTGGTYARLTRPGTLRLAFEDLGPTYIKLGQIIASSPGLFTPPYVEEFRSCLDSVRPFSFETVKHILLRELGEKGAQLTVDPKPLASASIAQVHAATFADGRQVVVKVQRPNIEKRVTADVHIMHFGARVAAAVSRDVALANPTGVIEDFGETIREELDFTKEGRNMDEFNRIMVELGHENVRAPEVLWDFTTKHVLTMERFFGYNVDDVESIRAANLDAETMLLTGMRAWFQCVMFYGLFHGDVHAGNLMWLKDGRIGLLDFGIVGRFDDLRRTLVARYVMAMATGQYGDLSRVVVEMGGVKKGVDVDALAADMAKAYGPMREKTFAQLKFSDLLPNILAMARRHGARLPKEFILIIKQVLYFDRYARLLAPDLNIFSDPRVFLSLAEDVQRALALTASKAPPQATAVVEAAPT
ncbi:MAG: AarF/ABC1/UbiB kinase family protein [Deltaproteobacteria bacterium]|nr:AarF/ABC1/UbiB kinase family protein [Deltaproteobacteria bacterium]